MAVHVSLLALQHGVKLYQNKPSVKILCNPWEGLLVIDDPEMSSFFLITTVEGTCSKHTKKHYKSWIPTNRADTVLLKERL